MLKVRLAGDHLYRKLLLTWLSLVMSLMVSFCAVLLPTDEIWDLIESVSEGFPTYFFNETIFQSISAVFKRGGGRKETKSKRVNIQTSGVGSFQTIIQISRMPQHCKLPIKSSDPTRPPHVTKKVGTKMRTVTSKSVIFCFVQSLCNKKIVTLPVDCLLGQNSFVRVSDKVIFSMLSLLL